MTLALNGYAISNATLRRVRRGITSADVVLVDAPALAVGNRVTLQVGDFSQVGTLRPGGEFGGTAYWTVIAGAGTWDRPLPARSYHDDGGVMLSRVAADLAREAEELGIVLDVADRSLGVDWTRRAGTGADAIDALTGRAWYVAADGITHLGDRPAGALTAPPTLTIESHDPSTKVALVRLADEAIAALAPGVVLTADGLPDPGTITIGSVTVRASPSTMDLEVFGEKALPDLLADLLDSLAAGLRYNTLVPMRVAEVQSSKASVVTVAGDARAVAIPGSPLLPMAGGVPGMRAVLAPGADVLVGWQGADPGSPTIALYLPGTLPASLGFDATGNIDLGASGSVAYPALAQETQTNLSALRVAVLALGGTVGPMLPVAAAKVRVQ